VIGEQGNRFAIATITCRGLTSPADDLGGR
jgi:hypothetical protein